MMELPPSTAAGLDSGGCADARRGRSVAGSPAIVSVRLLPSAAAGTTMLSAPVSPAHSPPGMSHTSPECRLRRDKVADSVIAAESRHVLRGIPRRIQGHPVVPEWGLVHVAVNCAVTQLGSTTTETPD